MSAYGIAEAFRAAFAADADFGGVACLNEQTGDKATYPLLVFAVKTVPMNGSGTAERYELTVWAMSNGDRKLPTDADPAIAHGELVEKVKAKFLGAGKAALKDALDEQGAFVFRGWSPGASDPEVTGRSFETPFVVNGTALAVRG